MKNSFQKFIIFFFALLFTIEPILQLSQIPNAKAADTTAATEEEPIADVAYDGTSTSAQPANIDSAVYKISLKTNATTAGTDDIVSVLARIHSEEDRNAGIGLEEALSNQVEPRIILNGDDQQALKILWRLSGTWMMPDFEREPEAIFVQYPKFKNQFIKEKKDVYDSINTTLGHEIISVDDIAAIKVANYAQYLDLTHYAQAEWTKDLGDVADEVKKQTDNAIANKVSPDAKVVEMMSDVTGETIEAINQIFINNASADSNSTAKEKYNNLMDTFSVNIKAVKIDIRVVNLLVYLVTPKTQGGAGHYKIKVKRLLSGYTAPKKIFSRESETIYNKGPEIQSNSTTAADYGQNKGTNTQSVSTTPQALNSDDPDALAIVSDSDGESYNAFVSEALAADATATDIAESDKNISAHADGQAVDISEVDDIRCTLIKKKRIGGYTRSKFLQRPIKLAWQTENGFAKNGGGDLYKSDMANVLKSFSNDSIKELINEFGGDVTTYDGDLSSAGFSDVAMLIGKSIFGQIINSPGGNLQGYQFGDTLTQLGGMYMADYLGLPREMFTEGNIPDSYEELAQRIGTAAIEKRLDLPIGTFGGSNLWEMLKRVGQRKLEFEMNLTSGALDNYFKTDTSILAIKEERSYLIGKAIIEQELNLPKGSFTGKNNIKPATFSELKDSLGKIKTNTVFRDPIYTDNMLHIELGSTEKLVNGTMSPYLYASLIGQTREDNTIYGFQYMAAADAAYELDEGTFTKVINGDASALVAIGIKNMARVLTTGDEEREAFTLWVNANLAKTGPQQEACSYEDPLTVTIASGKIVTLSDEKATAVGLNSGEMFTMFACPDSNPSAVFQNVGSKILRDSLVQYYLTPDEKIKFNLTEVNHTFHSSDSDKQFYVTRAYETLNILDQIKNNWSANNKDPEYQRVKKLIDDSYNSIKAIVDTSMPITTVDQAKKAARNVAVAVNKLKSDVSGMRFGANRYINKINGTIIDIDRLVRNVSEIIAGKEITSTDTLTLSEIPAYALSETPDNTANAPVLNNQSTPRSSNASLIGLTANKQTFMALLARKMKPADFFLVMATDKVETALDLPQNSLIYFVQNYEKKGLGTIDSFYSAVGQAKIEETFNMPSKYFQGPLINDPALTAYDFRTDLEALYEYDKYDIEQKLPPPITATDSSASGEISLKPSTTFHNSITDAFQTPNFDNFNNDGTPKSNLTDEEKAAVAVIVKKEHYIVELMWIKTQDPGTFDFLVNKAQQNYTAQMQAFYNSLDLTSKLLEANIDQVVINVDKHKLNDGIRTAEQDLLFRMGIPGSFDALKTANSVSWVDANGRAGQIDKLFNLPNGSTKALFTGERIDYGSGIYELSKKDKQILVAKMGISPVAIDKLLQFLNGQIPLSELEKNAVDITNVGDNPFLGSSSDTCDTSIFTQNAVTGQMTAGTIIPNSWFYFDDSIDTREGKTFGSRIQAENYASEHKEDQRTYVEEISYGLAKITGQSADALLPRIMDFLKGNTDTIFSGTMDQAVNDHIEQTMGVSAGTLNKLTTKTKATPDDVPLVAYKRAVGQRVVGKTINSKIFGALGIKIDPDLFSGNEFFEIMQGDYSSLLNIAGSMIDQQLGVPSGSIINILTAKSSAMRTCAVAEIGGSIVGKFVGLDYVSLKGNIYENIGRSRLEKTLGLPQNSFSGKDITQLINNVGVVNFYLAFQYPIGDIDLNTPLRSFYGDTYAKSVEKYSNNFKLKKIKEFLDINTNLSSNSEKQDVYNNLKTAMINHVNETAANAVIAHGSDRTKDGKWRQKIWDIDKKDEVLAYLDRIDSIDRSFGIAIGTTAAFVYGRGEETIEETQQVACNVLENGAPVADPDNAGRIRWDDCNDKTPGHDTLNIRNSDGTIKTTVVVPKTSTHGSGTCECDMEKDPVINVVYATSTAALTPDLYIKKVSAKTLLGVGAYSAMDLFNFDMSEEQKQAVVGTLTHFSNWSQEGSAGYAKIYDGFSTIFSLHLDTKAGLDGGSIRKMIENPGRIGDVLLPQAARKLDQQLGINPADRWSISGVYARYLNSSPDINTVKTTPEQDCGPEQTAINEQERQLAIREKAIYDWIDANGGFVEFTLADSPGYTATGVAPDHRIEDNPNYMTKVNELGAINQERSTLQGKKNTCKASNRYGNQSDQDTRTYAVTGDPITRAITRYCSTTTLSDTNKEMCQDIRAGGNVKWKFAWMIITDFASDMISDKIFEVTKNTLRMPPEDIKHFFVNGDMRYFTTALMTYGANTFLNSLSTNSDQREALPTGMQITYDMFKLWIIGDSGVEDYSARAAAAGFNYLDPNGPNFESTLPPMVFGDIFNTDDIPGGVLGTLTSSNFLIQTNNSSRTATSVNRDQLTTFSNRQSEVVYNGGKPVDITATQAYIDGVNTKADDGRKFLSDNKSVDRNSLGPTEITPYSEADSAIKEKVDLDASMQQAKTGTRERFKKQAQYRMMDAVLWTKDHNVFPGFSYMLLEGSGKQKNVAIALYIKNGLINSQFFGKDIAFLKKIETETGITAVDWLAIDRFASDLISNSTGGLSADNVLTNASGTGALDAIGRFVSVHSENWFGFKLDPAYAEGLMVSITTGHWGFSGNGEEIISKGGKDYKFLTLGGVFKQQAADVMINKAFSWADRQSGWKPGTAYEVFSTGRRIYTAWNTYKQVKNIESAMNAYEIANDANNIAKTAKTAAALANANANLEAVQAANKEGNTLVNQADGDVSQAKGMALAGIGMLVSKYISDAAMRWINAQAGQDIAEMEIKNSLVPGSTMILIEGAVSYGVGTALAAAFPNAGLFAELGPAGLYAALAMFVAVNLFGYYDTDLKCSADGYYPEIGSPSIASDSNSGLGTWDGMDDNASKKNTMASAQYKAKRLILDVLEMHKNPIYKDTYPSQIMTGRNEDVLAVNDSINENMCSVIGLVSIAGICGGNTQAGVWENLQTTTYTHIGF